MRACLALVMLMLGGCEIIRVQLRNPITTSVMLEPGSLDPIEDKLEDINANLTEGMDNIKKIALWITGSGGGLAILSLSGGGGYMWLRKRKKNGDG